MGCRMRAQFSADILLVEDEANDAEMVLAALRKRNIPGEVVHLTDGDQFMDSIFYASLYSSWHDIKIPRVILLDLKLKTVNGLDVLRLLKADARARTDRLMHSRLSTRLRTRPAPTATVSTYETSFNA